MHAFAKGEIEIVKSNFQEDETEWTYVLNVLKSAKSKQSEWQQRREIYLAISEQ